MDYYSTPNQYSQSYEEDENEEENYQQQDPLHQQQAITYDNILSKINENIKLQLHKENKRVSFMPTEPIKNNNNYFTASTPLTNPTPVLRPKNIQEYRKMVLQQKILNHNRNVYLRNIKSKKLLFSQVTNNNNKMNTNKIHKVKYINNYSDQNHNHNFQLKEGW